MEIKVLESEKNLLKLELMGKSHTLANALVKELWNDPETVIAGYNLKHPQVNNTILVLETKKKDPKKVLIDALKRMDKNYQEFATKFKKIAK
ncbi:MAG: DNA-directed RNA polymerase subunit L [archaeon]